MGVGWLMRRKNILVVDDDRGISETMKDILEATGNDVDTADDGTKAIDLVSKNDYDLVLMDVRMPGMSGIDTCKKMRENGSRVNIVFITACIDKDTSRAIADECCSVMHKPIDMEMLSRVIGTSSRVA
jgi:DNA-binding response OmpR family regulator